MSTRAQPDLEEKYMAVPAWAGGEGPATLEYRFNALHGRVMHCLMSTDFDGGEEYLESVMRSLFSLEQITVDRARRLHEAELLRRTAAGPPPVAYPVVRAVKGRRNPEMQPTSPPASPRAISSEESPPDISEENPDMPDTSDDEGVAPVDGEARAEHGLAGGGKGARITNNRKKKHSRKKHSRKKKKSRKTHSRKKVSRR